MLYLMTFFAILASLASCQYIPKIVRDVEIIADDVLQAEIAKDYHGENLTQNKQERS